MTLSKTNEFKASKADMAKAKYYSTQAYIEWCMLNTSNIKGDTFTQMQYLEWYPTRLASESKNGIAMITTCHNGKEFQYLMVERNDLASRVNRLKGKIKMFEKFQDSEEVKYLHQIFRWHTTKSDQTRDSKERYKTIAISQKVEYLGTLKNCIKKAVEKGGIDNYNEMKKFAKENGISLKGCGVVYDYSQRRYKAVFVDYSL